MIEANYSIKVEQFLEEDPKTQPLLLPGVWNLVVCFTSFDPETEPVLRAFSVPKQDKVRTVGLLLDSDKPVRSVKAKLSKLVQNRFACFWVGPNG
jgi:flavin-dependent dehydrogenase